MFNLILVIKLVIYIEKLVEMMELVGGDNVYLKNLLKLVFCFLVLKKFFF